MDSTTVNSEVEESCVERLNVQAIEEEPYFDSSNEPVNQPIPVNNVQPAQFDPLIHPFCN